MRNLFLVILLLLPIFVFSQNEVGPEGYNLIGLFLLIFGSFVVWILMMKFKNKSVTIRKKPSFFSFGRLIIELQKDRKYRPATLTLLVKNNKRKDLDIEAPVLIFRKLWSIRKFKLKGINRSEIYPLYLEAGKTHELRISLSVFHEHDRKIRKYYWAKVLLQDTKGRKYSSKYVTLRKSLFS